MANAGSTGFLDEIGNTGKMLGRITLIEEVFGEDDQAIFGMPGVVAVKELVKELVRNLVSDDKNGMDAAVCRPFSAERSGLVS